MHDEDWGPSRLPFSIYHNLHRQPHLGHSTTQQCLSLAQVIQVVITTNILCAEWLDYWTGVGGLPGRGNRTRQKQRHRDSYSALAEALVIPIQKLSIYITVNMLHLHYKDQKFCLGK